MINSLDAIPALIEVLDSLSEGVGELVDSGTGVVVLEVKATSVVDLRRANVDRRKTSHVCDVSGL